MRRLFGIGAVTAGTALVVTLLITPSVDAQLDAQRPMSDVTVEVRDHSGRRFGRPKVKLVRLNGFGDAAEIYEGANVSVPYGRYEVRAYLDRTWLKSSFVEIWQERVRVAIGMSLLRCCVDDGLGGETTDGELTGRVAMPSEGGQLAVTIHPLWSNGFQLTQAIDDSGEFRFFPVDLGTYIVVLTRDEKVLQTKSVVISQHGVISDLVFD